MKNITWDEYFIGLAQLSAKRSKDPNTKVGACLVDQNKRVIGLGYNGMPKGNDNFPWEREGKPIDTKYPYVIHAEMNAILNSTKLIKDASIYVSLFPCSNCAKLLVQAGVIEVVYSDDKYKGTEDDDIAQKILKESGVKVRKVKEVNIEIK